MRFVRRSWVCTAREWKSTSRANFESPRMRSPGRYPTCATPTKGSMWCSHRDWTGMFSTSTSSSYASSFGKVVRSNSGTSSISA